MSSFSLHERYRNRIRPLLVGGYTDDNPPRAFTKSSLQGHGTRTSEKIHCFPLYEDRSVKPENFGEFRQKHPHQCFGAKLTVAVVEKANSLQLGMESKHLSVFPEVGIDELEFIGDANGWTRIARFASNMDCEQYDSRWWTGDYGQYVLSEMLIHGISSFAIEDYLQASEPHLENESNSIPFENFQITIHMANINMRVPAVTDDTILSCDAIARCDEMIVKMSHDIPRDLLNNDSTSKQISFGIQQNQSEPYAILLNDNKADKMPAFGFYLTFIGASLTLAHIIPSCSSGKPEQLLLPTNVELLVHLETKSARAATEDVGSGIDAAIHVAVHQFEGNVDFDLLALAHTTVLLHCNILKEFNKEFASHSSIRESSTSKIQKMTEMFLGHADQCWKNGEVSTSCSLSVQMHRMCIWRQNVSRRQPMSTNDTGVIELLPFLMVADLVSKDVKINFCMQKSANERRILGTLSVQELSLSICDFDRILNLDAHWVKIHGMETLDSSVILAAKPMVEIFSIGRNESNCRAVDICVEENKGDTCSYAFTTDFSNGIIRSDVESLSKSVLLLAEALFVSFPTLSMDTRASGDVSDDCNIKQPPTDKISTAGTRIEMKSVLDWFNDMATNPIGILLVRIDVKNVQVLISDGRSNDDRFALELIDSNMILTFSSSSGHDIPNMLERFATRQGKWSSIVELRNGFYHAVKSRQHIQLIKSGCDTITRQPDKENVVSAFDFIYNCYRGKVELSTSDDFVYGSTEKMMNCFIAVQNLVHRCQAELRRSVFELNVRKRASYGDECHSTSASPIYSACVSTASALASLKSLSLSMKDKIILLTKMMHTFKAEANEEIAKLRISLLSKENERLAAHSLVSSEATGWLRVGKSQHPGLRGSFASILWNQWVVLRRSALLFFACPGQVSIDLSR